MSLCASGLCLLWLLCSVASGLYAGRVAAPSLYCRDLNRWLRVFGLEWRAAAGSGGGGGGGSWADGELRCLSGLAVQRRARREKDKAAAAERERKRLQATVEADTERNRLHFLELLEREEAMASDADSSGDGGSGSGSSTVLARGAHVTLFGQPTDNRERVVHARAIVTESDSPQPQRDEKA